MLGKNSRQIDVFNNMIFQSLVPKDHLLVKIDSIIDFSFVYDKVKDKYSPLGRGSKDSLILKTYLKIEQKYAEYIYLETYDELQKNENCRDAFGIF